MYCRSVRLETDHLLGLSTQMLITTLVAARRGPLQFATLPGDLGQNPSDFWPAWANPSPGRNAQGSRIMQRIIAIGYRLSVPDACPKTDNYL